MPEAVAKELTCWKEIAAYLGVSVRAAQEWERQHNLPIQRRPGVRGRVFADTAELDAWRKGSRAVAPAAVPRRWGKAVLVAALACAIVAVLVFAGSATAPRQPSSFRVESNALLILDDSGRPLWTHRFDHALGMEEYAPLIPNRRVWIGDIDGDGQREVLFLRLSREAAHCLLLCFSATGAEKWRYTPSRTVATAKERFAPPFRARDFDIVHWAGKTGIALTSSHHTYYPSQVALLSPDGRVLREYWHSGHFGRLMAADLDKDGNDEIYLGGVSNAYRQATLVALDPRDLGGASVETNAPYQILSIPAGRERARILFARSCINMALRPYNYVADLAATSDGILAAVTDGLGTLEYELDRRLRLHALGLADDFPVSHRRLRAAGELDHDFSEAEMEPLRVLRYLKEMR